MPAALCKLSPPGTPLRKSCRFGEAHCHSWGHGPTQYQEPYDGQFVATLLDLRKYPRTGTRPAWSYRTPGSSHPILVSSGLHAIFPAIMNHYRSWECTGQTTLANLQQNRKLPVANNRSSKAWQHRLRLASSSSPACIATALHTPDAWQFG